MAKPTTVADRSEALEAKTPASAPKPTEPTGVLKWVDERTGAGNLRHNLRKVFPDHWSFLLGEIALYSFIVLLITGVFLTLWFKPSMGEISYDGSYQLLKGQQMSEAFASTLDITFDVRGGLLIRQIHHWAAILFVAAAFAHMFRVFITGAFRKPREINWLIGIGLASLAMVEGMAGYTLPDDLLSGTGLRFTDGLIRSIPLVGTWVEFFVFNGQFPGDVIISRFYIAHVLLLPGILLALVGAHMVLLVFHKHTQYPGPGRTERNVVGYPLFPVYAAKAGGFFFLVFGVLVLMGALFQINPVWKFGPYNPAQVTAGSQPDWYMGWVEGAVRIMPGWESHWGPTTWSWNIFLPAVGLLTAFFTVLAIWPFFERWITGDNREHHLLDRPQDSPTRTGVAVAGATFFVLMLLGGGNDIIATKFALDLNAITWFLRFAVFIVPIIAFVVARRICIGIQRRERERVLHGSESGVMVRSAEGGFSEAHAPITHEEAFVATQHQTLAPIAGNGLRAKLSRWFLAQPVPKPTPAEIEQAHSHEEHGAVDDADDSPAELSDERGADDREDAPVS